MGVAQSLRKVVGRFGAGDQFDDYEDETYAESGDLDDQYEERLDVRRLRRARGADFDDIYAQEPSSERLAGRDGSVRPLALVRPQRLEFGLVAPQSFAEAQQIADRFRHDTPVIVDLQGCEAALAKRLVDFCSGLTYALDGSLQIIDRGILVLAPRTVELSGEATVGLRAKGFYNQA